MGFLEEQEKKYLEEQAREKKRQEAKVIAQAKQKAQEELLKAEIRAEFALWREELLAGLPILSPGIDMAEAVIEMYVERLRRMAPPEDTITLPNGKSLLKKCIVQRFDEIWPLGEYYKAKVIKPQFWGKRYGREEQLTKDKQKLTEDTIDEIVAALPRESQALSIPVLVLKSRPFLSPTNIFSDCYCIFNLLIRPQLIKKPIGYSVDWIYLDVFCIGYARDGNHRELQSLKYITGEKEFNTVNFVLMFPSHREKFLGRMQESNARAEANPLVHGIDKFSIPYLFDDYLFMSPCPSKDYQEKDINKYYKYDYGNGKKSTAYKIHENYPFFAKEGIEQKFLLPDELTAQNLESLVELVFKRRYSSDFIIDLFQKTRVWTNKGRPLGLPRGTYQR